MSSLELITKIFWTIVDEKKGIKIEKMDEEFGLATNFNIQEFYEFGKEDMEQFIKSRPKMF